MITKKPHSEETPQKDWGTLKRLNFRTGEFELIPLKGDFNEIKDLFDSFDDDPENEGQTMVLLDEWGREVPDPRPMVVEVKELTTEQKIFNQYVLAHNKAALELQNLPWDMSTPEKAKAVINDLLNLDMPEQEMEFISSYETLEMAEDYPELPPQLDPAPAPAPAPEPDPTPAPTPDPEPKT